MRGRVSLRPLSLLLALESSVSVERRDSRFAGIFEALSWPSDDWTVAVRRETTHALNDELVAADALLIEQNDEWLVCRRYLSAESMALLDAMKTEDSHTIRKRKRKRRWSSSTSPEPPTPPTSWRYTTSHDLT